MTRPKDMRQCPICLEHVNPPYDILSNLWLMGHVYKKHLVCDGLDPKRSAVKCMCGKEFRGVTTWSRHLAILSPDEQKQHLEMAPDHSPHLVRRKRSGKEGRASYAGEENTTSTET